MTIYDKIIAHYKENINQDLSIYSQRSDGVVSMTIYTPRLMGEDFVRTTIEIGNVIDGSEIESVVFTHDNDNTNVVFRNSPLGNSDDCHNKGIIVDSLINKEGKTFYAYLGYRVWRKGVTCSLQQYERYQGLIDTPGYGWITPKPSYPYKTSFIDRFDEMGIDWWVSSRDLSIFVEETDLLELRLSL